jgi:pimeloyl-ACP methyl ester carboxylesterase
MPGHGRTAPATRSPVFLDTATELAEFIRAAGLDRPNLAVVGHSWGGMVTAHLPAAGLAPRTLVLLDPPSLTLARLRALTESPTERDYATVEEATAAVRAANPTWSEGDVAAKAQALTEFNPQLVLDVLLKNGDWDAGMAALRHSNAAASDAWLIRGEWDTGGFIPDSRVPRIEAQLGADHVITITDAPHSPQRTHPEATVLAILRALGG